MLHNPYSSHHHDVRNPSSPYDGVIPSGLVPGKQIFVSGYARPGADRIQFNLLGRSGHALHINPRFNDNVIVRNSEAYGAWGAEDRAGPFLFQRGAPFELVITVENDKYRVHVNNVHAFDFYHRVPLQEVERLNIVGDVDLNRIAFSAGHQPHGNEVHNPSIPHVGPIPNGTYPGKLIQVSGFVPHHSNRFSVNIQDGPGIFPPNINLHLSARFDQNTIVLNNSRFGAWGGEERSHLAFQKGAPFELLILVESHEFKLAVNGRHHGSFAHRNPFGEANHIAIEGDVQITSIRQF